MGPFKRRQGDGTRHHIRNPEQEVGSSLWGACNKVVRMQHPSLVEEKVGALISEGDWQPGLSSQVRYILISRSCGISVLGQINSRPRTFSLHYSMFAVAEWARATVSFGILQDGLLVRVYSAKKVCLDRIYWFLRYLCGQVALPCRQILDPFNRISIGTALTRCAEADFPLKIHQPPL